MAGQMKFLKVVLQQFLLESVIIGLIGGGLGIITGVAVSYTICIIFDFPLIIPIWPVFFEFILSIMIGVVFGFFPAYQASRLHPIETLRYD